jgi:tetratricopeptide (TPR) repeat protein
MKKTLIGLAFSAAMLVGTSTVQAQIEIPAASPAATVTQKVGLTDVSVSYSRPSLRGRTVGKDVAIYGEMWRTGANSPTLIKFTDDITIQGNKVPAGEYVLMSIPAQNEWTVILHKNKELWGNNDAKYDQANDQLRFTVKPQTNPRAIESFTINFANLKSNSADVELLWGKEIASFTITTDVDSKVMAQIQEKVVNSKEVSPNTYAAAASYYMSANKDMKQALDWMKKANAKDAKFWNLHAQAKIQANLKDYKGAIKTAEQSIELAKKANNPEYVRMNEQAIAEWKKMK